LFILKFDDDYEKETQPVLRSLVLKPCPLVDETLNAIGAATVDQSLKAIV
jgi:hypothetical protein